MYHVRSPRYCLYVPCWRLCPGGRKLVFLYPVSHKSPARSSRPYRYPCTAVSQTWAVRISTLRYSIRPLAQPQPGLPASQNMHRFGLPFHDITRIISLGWFDLQKRFDSAGFSFSEGFQAICACVCFLVCRAQLYKLHPLQGLGEKACLT